MGIYLDRLENLSENIPELDFNFTAPTNIIEPAIAKANEKSYGDMGISLLLVYWFSMFFYISHPANNFGLTKTQALISTTTYTFCIAIYFMWTEVLVSSQHFIWVALLIFVVFVIGVFNYN